LNHFDVATLASIKRYVLSSGEEKDKETIKSLCLLIKRPSIKESLTVLFEDALNYPILL